MRLLLALSCIVSCIVPCVVPFAAASMGSAASAEFPLRLTLEIDGVRQDVVDGQEVTVTIAGKEVRAKATVHANRRFDSGGMQFEFPREMAVGRDALEGVDLWTLDGGDCILHVQVYSFGDASELAGEVLGSMLATLQEDHAAPVACELNLGGVAHPAKRGRVRIADSELEVTATGFVAGGRQVVFMVQDSLDDDGKVSAEAKGVLELLQKTFAIAPAK